MFEIRVFENKDYLVKIENNLEIFFPKEKSNRHYQEYLVWLSEGNTPEIINEVE